MSIGYNPYLEAMVVERLPKELQMRDFDKYSQNFESNNHLFLEINVRISLNYTTKY